MLFTKGNKLAPGGRRPGAGRKPLATRQICQESFHDRIQALCAIADDHRARVADRISALALLAKVGMPKQVESVDEIPTRVEFVLPSREDARLKKQSSFQVFQDASSLPETEQELSC